MTMRIAVVILLAFSGSASAHAFLLHANPAAGATLSSAPKSLTLDFSEALEPTFSNVNVVDAAGHPVVAAASAASGTKMSVTLQPLKPGTYSVAWHALSVDTHRTQGSFRFTVKPR